MNGEILFIISVYLLTFVLYLIQKRMKNLLYLTLFCLTMLMSGCEGMGDGLDGPSGDVSDSTSPVLPGQPNTPNDDEENNVLNPSNDPCGIDFEVFVPKSFSVSEEKQVVFSSGNLQYHPANDEWRFASTQLCFVGADNANIASTYQGWIDLFGDGTGANPTNASMDDQNDYNTLVDWGVNWIGDDAPYTWRSLSMEEWYYLLALRANAKDKVGIAQVCGVNGLILLPDNWEAPMGVTFKAGGYEGSEVTTYASFQSFTGDEWILLAGSGAVFLPAAGNRAGVNVNLVGQYGLYRGFYNDGYDGTSKEYLHMEAGNVSIGIAPRNLGGSVRLVKDVQ